MTNDTFQTMRQLAVRAGDALTILLAYGPEKFPTEEGVTFDEYVSRALSTLAELEAHTRSDWKKRLLGVVGSEVRQAHDASVRSLDSDKARALLHDAYHHFRDYLEGSG